MLGGSTLPRCGPLSVLLYPPQRDENPATPPHISIQRQRRRFACDQGINRWGDWKRGLADENCAFQSKVG
jgi:hypothetical protein